MGLFRKKAEPPPYARPAEDVEEIKRFIAGLDPDESSMLELVIFGDLRNAVFVPADKTASIEDDWRLSEHGFHSVMSGNGGAWRVFADGQKRSVLVIKQA